MKNKTFLHYKNASLYFSIVSQNHIAFFIHNMEENCYEVIDQDMYDHYRNEFNLAMELLDCNN